MLTLIVSIIIGVAAGYVSLFELEYGLNWSIINAAAVFAICWIGLGFFIRRQINKVNTIIQNQMEAAQKKINRKLQVFQSRPGANAKSVQKTLEKDQNAAILEALKTTSKIDRYFKWNLLLKKQISTMRMMFYYQMKNFKKVDELIPKCLLLDPRAVAFKMARMYKRKDPKLDKFFKKKIKRAKGENAALLYALYSWALVKNEQADEALKVLTKACKKVDHPTIKENREKLANNKAKQFSNSGLGELWYSLYLEDPKIKQKKVRRKF